MENKTWIVVVLIILVALVAYNFKGMTGQDVTEFGRDQITKITVNPTRVSFDRYDTMKLLTIEVDVGSLGVDKDLELYRVTPTGGVRVSSKIAVCNKHTCTEDVTLTFKFSAGTESGTYFFRGERDNYDTLEHDLKFDSNKFIVA